MTVQPDTADTLATVLPEPQFNPQSIPGVTKAIADEFEKRGYDSADCIVELGEEGLMLIEGMSARRAKTILNGAKKQAEITRLVAEKKG